jgi:hypothetical protein
MLKALGRGSFFPLSENYYQEEYPQGGGGLTANLESDPALLKVCQ